MMFPLMPAFHVGPMIIRFPTPYFGRDKKFTRLAHRWTHWIDYRGDYGYIRLDPPWAPGPLLPQVNGRIRALCQLEILADWVGMMPDEFLFEGFRIHDLLLRFDFPIGDVIWCWRPKFYVDAGRQFSVDHRIKLRGDGSAKEEQYSLLCYEALSLKGRAGPWRLTVRISGKYRSMIGWEDLADPTGLSGQFWRRLSKRITQLVDPKTFQVKDSYRLFIAPWFWNLFASVGWFSGEKFLKRRSRDEDKRGVLHSLYISEEVDYAVRA